MRKLTVLVIDQNSELIEQDLSTSETIKDLQTVRNGSETLTCLYGTIQANSLPRISFC